MMAAPYRAKTDETRAVRRVHLLAPVRAGARFAILLLWSLACFLSLVFASPLALVSRPLSRKVRKAISRTWVRAAPGIIGTRIIVHGTAPKPPFFLVSNHLSWIDLFVVSPLCDAVYIVEEPVGRIPMIGALVKGLRPIFVRRVKEDTSRVNALMVRAIEAGQSLMMAPETPETTSPPGSGVRRFRGGLLESAVRTGTAVHYLSLTYRTPAGYPPASKAMIFGPNPFLRTPDGKIPESELKAYGPERSFMRHLLGVLALPWHEVIVTFGPEPIAGTDRIALANRLHEAVERLFTPIE